METLTFTWSWDATFSRSKSQNHINLSMRICASSKETPLCASIWRISPSNGDSNFGFDVALSLAMCMSLICTWWRRPNVNLAWWVSCSLLFWESKKQPLLAVFLTTFLQVSNWKTGFMELKLSKQIENVFPLWKQIRK